MYYPLIALLSVMVVFFALAVCQMSRAIERLRNENTALRSLLKVAGIALNPPPRHS